MYNCVTLDQYDIPSIIFSFRDKSPRSKWEGRITTFTNVVVSSDGWFVHNKHCHAVINGVCKTPDSWRQPKHPIQNYDRVISIAMYWDDGIWHFLLESFVGLAHAHTSDCYLHVLSENKWAKFCWEL
jgi:hypothetical protein